MPTPERIREASRQRRQRVCTICQAEFEVRKSSHAGLSCSPACASVIRRRNSTGRRQSAETVAKRMAGNRAHWDANPEGLADRQAKVAAKLREWHTDPENAALASSRSSERMTRLHQDPDFQRRRNERSSRTMKATWQNRRELFVAYAIERYARFAEQGVGLLSSEAVARKNAAAKWIMTKAQEALHAETNYNEVFAEVQDRLRREMPFDETGNEADYFDYLKRLGSAVVNSPECRAIADVFMAEAIPRFGREWRARSEAA